MLNVVWLFVDGVRRYHSDDDRSRLDFMDEFSKDAVEFKNVVTSAPSTFMSLSAMMSGMPSYFINRNFDDFRFDKERIPSLTSDLESNGYNVHSFLMHPSTRETMINIYPMVAKKYWPKDLSHRKWWSNDDINRIVGKTLEMGVENKPSFFFVDFNCRKDFKTSEKVKWADKKFKEAGFNDDNTITILCSDHGYPDSSKETGNPEYYTNNKLTHDLILTDDNIMIPFFIKYPGCSKGMKVETTVSSIDLYPTITDLLGIPPKENLIGQSLKPLMEGKVDDDNHGNRFHRTDSRLALQTGRGTCIRNHQYKYVYYHDNLRGGGQEEFFDIVNDPLEASNLIKSKKISNELSIFKAEYSKSEEYFMNYQLEYLIDVFKKEHNDIAQLKNIVVIESGNIVFTKILINVLNALSPDAGIKVFSVGNPKDKSHNLNDESTENAQNVDLNKDNLSVILNNILVDMVIVPLDSSRNNQQLIRKIKKIKSGKKLFVDYNLGGYKQPFFSSQIKKTRSAWPFIKQEPSYIFYFLYKSLRSLASGLVKKHLKK
jgi:hypothetical protein